MRRVEYPDVAWAIAPAKSPAEREAANRLDDAYNALRPDHLTSREKIAILHAALVEALKGEQTD